MNDKAVISMVTNDDQWHWQEPGTAWRGVGVYHVTLTVPSREPLLGRLVIPQNDPSQARIERTELGNAVVNELYVMCRHYPAIRIFQFCLMPDHLHFVIQVTRTMQTSIRSVIRGYWQGVKKLGRAYSLGIAPELNSGTRDEGGKRAGGEPELNSGRMDEGGKRAGEEPELNSGTRDEGGRRAEEGGRAEFAPELNSGTRDEGGRRADEGGRYYAFPIFTERPFIRPLSRRGQLNAMIRYVQMNPQRLATKRLMPGFFRVQRGIEIAGRSYDGVGNVALLHAARFMPVHVRRTMVEAAKHGNNQPLRDYMNGCVLAARGGCVMVSPFISPDEKLVMNVLLAEKRPFIVLADNGFRDYYKPTHGLFDACAAGRVLILSPWPYDADKRHISRDDCVALNAMAEEIAREH